MTRLILQQVAAPSTPALGKSVLFVDSSDQKAKVKSDNGITYDVTLSRDAYNYLCNGCFSFAQRQVPGTPTNVGSVGGRAYSPDRWGTSYQSVTVNYSRVDTDTVGVEAGLQTRFYGKFTKISNATKFHVSQVIEGNESQTLCGRTVRFTIKMKYSIAAAMTVRLGMAYLNDSGTVDAVPGGAGNFITAWGANGVDPTLGANLVYIAPNLAENGAISGNGVTCVLTNGWVRYSGTFTIPSGAKNLIAMVWTNSGPAISDELNLAEAGLYEGDELREWICLSLPQEIAKCQRFFAKTFDIDQVPITNLGTYNFSFIAGKVGALSNYGMWRFPVSMRGTPVVTTYNPMAANANPRDVIAVVDCVLGAVTPLGDSYEILATGNAATLVGNQIAIHLSADAEL